MYDISFQGKHELDAVSLSSTQSFGGGPFVVQLCILRAVKL